MATLTYLSAAVLDPEQRSVEILKMHNVTTTSYSNGNWDSSVSVVTRLWVGYCRTQHLIPVSSKRLFFSSSDTSTMVLWPTQQYIQYISGALSPRIKWPRHEDKHPFSSNIKGHEDMPPPKCFHTMVLNLSIGGNFPLNLPFTQRNIQLQCPQISMCTMNFILITLKIWLDMKSAFWSRS
jgi:hypothetical protein